MTEGEPMSDEERDEKEDIRVGYQVAVQLWKIEGEQNFARFNVMLVANGIIATVIAVILNSPSSSSPSPAALIFMPFLTVFLSVMGIFICFVSLLIMIRGFDYQMYYVTSAREIEEKYLSKSVKTVSRGKIFADGDWALFDLEDPPRLRMTWRLPRSLRSIKWLRGIQVLLWGVIVFFGILYGLIILFQFGLFP